MQSFVIFLALTEFLFSDLEQGKCYSPLQIYKWKNSEGFMHRKRNNYFLKKKETRATLVLVARLCNVKGPFAGTCWRVTSWTKQQSMPTELQNCICDAGSTKYVCTRGLAGLCDGPLHPRISLLINDWIICIAMIAVPKTNYYFERFLKTGWSDVFYLNTRKCEEIIMWARL